MTLAYLHSTLLQKLLVIAISFLNALISIDTSQVSLLYIVLYLKRNKNKFVTHIQ